MKPYMIIEGSNQALDTFEKKVADALELGYSLAGELVTHPANSEIKFYQTVIMAEDEEDDDYEDEEDEDEE